MSSIYRIGILAGMGPRSTAPFLEYVLDECEHQYGAQWDEDFPHMMVYSLPTPFHPKKPLDHPSMIRSLQVGMDALTSAQCAIIAIPCNVVHQYYEQLCEMTSLPLLNIIDETIGCLETTSATIGLLGTRSMIESGLYQTQLARLHRDVYWNATLQQSIDELIVATKKRGVHQETLSQWKNIEREFIQQGVSEVIIVCTDLTLYTQWTSLTMIDSTQALAKGLVKRYVKEQHLR
ncbi:aspartate/glutamate racemase family protein [Marininema halotolerans]|uniref:Aspartate racemase n=1 Tax=Marininema halotolerans TaxID=1155944 RepID=A0A1I6UBJ0_9BACL|nr:aspartate/glutamate racemase family protein [Marininema halotolerans]SFS98748.1 aspartate racemase [Marininema halotolerans]